MRAMRLTRQAPIASRPLEAVELADPAPATGEILVRLRVCGVCRTDLHVIEGDLPPRRLPLVPGHQAVGIVEAAGPGCSRHPVGTRVGIAWLRKTCGECDPCRTGSENLCAGSVYTGYHEDGGYAELARVPEGFAYAIPEAFEDAEAAPLLCAGIIGYRALRRSEIASGGRLGLYGFGSSAHVVLQIARARGCEVFVATRGERHRDLARSMGASWVGATFDPPPVLLDAAIVFAPAGDVVPAALRSIRGGGTVALAGIHMSPIPSLDYADCLFHEKNLRSVEANTRRDGEELFLEAAHIGLKPRVLRYRLEEANEALIHLKQDRVEGTAVLAIAGDKA